VSIKDKRQLERAHVVHAFSINDKRQLVCIIIAAVMPRMISIIIHAECAGL
jgi:hypothetical protein